MGSDKCGWCRAPLVFDPSLSKRTWCQRLFYFWLSLRMTDPSAAQPLHDEMPATFRSDLVPKEQG